MMRDGRFIAEHMGGPLTKKQHRQLILWACSCVEHVLILPNPGPDEQIDQALATARAWSEGRVSVGDARKASVALLALARQQSDPLMIAITRAAGHAVATAHMADHSVRAAAYALKAAQYAEQSANSERAWQLQQLPDGIRGLVEE